MVMKLAELGVDTRELKVAENKASELKVRIFQVRFTINMQNLVLSKYWKTH